jgi:septum formation protein
VSLILASTSPIRRAMLEQAGIAFDAVAPEIDERAHQARLTSAPLVAVELAAAKALAVSERRPGSWVVGSDSVVEVDGRIFSKPGSRPEAAEHLRFFSGKAMRLTSAVALARDGLIDWNHRETATLTVRDLADPFIDEYLKAEWPDVAYCVGVFRMEGRGVQLFERITGDYFTVLGMPLLALLGALRERKLLAS